jgi:hypothetical protein
MSECNRQASATKTPAIYIFSTSSINFQPPNMSDPNNEARILLALHALQNDPKLSLRRAAASTRSVVGLYIAARRVSFLRTILSQNHANYLI